MNKILTKAGQILAGTLAIPIILLGMVSTLSIANATAPEKENICHATSSESNPWEVVNVAVNDSNHNGHAQDYPYAGPVDDKGKAPKPEGDQWCADNAQTDEPKTCPEGQINIGTEQEPICRDEPTGCPYGDSIPLDSPKCVAPEEDVVEPTTPTPVVNEETQVFQGK